MSISQIHVYMYKERARFARSLLVRAWRCLSGYYALYCTKGLDYTVLTCSDLQFMFIPLASLVLRPFPRDY